MSFIPCEKHTDFYSDCLICELERLGGVVEAQKEVISAFLGIYDAQKEMPAARNNMGLDTLSLYSYLSTFHQLCEQIGEVNESSFK